MTSMSSTLRPTPIDWSLLVAVAMATVTGGFLGPTWLAATSLAAIALLACLTPPEKLVLWYVATLALIVPQGMIAMRLSIADLFAIPLIVRAAVAVMKGTTVPRAAMRWPLVAVAVAFVVATIVGYFRLGRFTAYAVINKDVGIAFQFATYLALLVFVRTRDEVLRLARAFVAGVGVANGTALIAVITSFAGVTNVVYLVSNARFYGWMQQPTVHGGLLMAAAMIEFGLLRTDRDVWAGVRWLNLALFAVGLGLTLSRGSWLSVAVAAATLIVALAWFDRDPAPVRRWPVFASATLWFVVPAFVVGQIFFANLGAKLFHSPAERAEQIKQTAIDTCKADPTLEMCHEVAQAAAQTPPPAVAPPAPVAPVPAPAHAPTPSVQPAPDAKLLGPMMNARGLDDRMAIVYIGWRAYTEDRVSRAFGAGLGTFYARSARDFGVPIIIHNTFEWFLVELGPFGLLAISWFWAQTLLNAYVAGRDTAGLGYLAMGALAAFAGLTIFCLTNEGFYQRQLWLVVFLLDRARALSARAPLVSNLSTV
ncbi:MAG TPA: hypothetical protein VFA59_01350 [Vicinamibacterales bacterium]|nr:hypothetical protein [Vicinamibacterales bacterium]